MNKKAFIILGIQAFIMVILFWLLVFYGKDEYEEASLDKDGNIESASLVVTGKEAKDGAATIRLTPASQLQTGIAIAKLEAASHQSDVNAYGSVLNLESFFDLRARYMTAIAEANVARSAIPSSQQQLQRLLTLNRDNKNVSDLAVAEAEAILKTNQAKLHAAETTAKSLRESIVQQWGGIIAEKMDSALIQNLMQGKQVLVQISLNDTSLIPNKNTSLLINPIGLDKQNIKATYISPSPKADPTIQGRTYIFSAPAENLRSGMRVNVQLQSSTKAMNGVIVPDIAVVWYANKAWVYQKSSTDLFVRRQVNTDIEANNDGENGWFNSGNFKVGDEVVVSGAQLLLSEEFKYQITNENDD